MRVRVINPADRKHKPIPPFQGAVEVDKRRSIIVPVIGLAGCSLTLIWLIKRLMLIGLRR